MQNLSLRLFGPGIWTSEGAIVPCFDFPYPTRMALIKLSNGGLFVWSPVMLSAALKWAVDATGPVRFLVAPNALHHLFLQDWKRAYPEARLLAPPGLRRRCPNLAFDADLNARPDPAWAHNLDQVVVGGSVAMTEGVFFHHASRTAIFADLIQNFPPDWFKGWRGLVARLEGVVSPHPGAPRDLRVSFVDRRKARAALDHILGWPIERVLIAHGECAPTEGAAFVRSAFSWMNGGRPSRATSGRAR